MGKAYYTEVRVTDFGPYTTKIILPLDAKVKAGAVDKDTFSVYVRRLTARGDQLMVPRKMSFDPEARKDVIPAKGILP